MKKFILIFLLLQVVTFGFAEDTQPQEPFDYTDPDTKVVYVCDPATGTATVKAGYDVWVGGNGEEYMVIDVITSSPEANGDIAIAEQLTIGGQVYCVTAIGNTAFRLNKNITSIIIPSSINSIGVFAFSGCNSLASVTSLIKEPFTYPEDCFSEETLGTATLRVPAGTRERYVAAGWNFKTIEEMEPEPEEELSDEQLRELAGKANGFAFRLFNQTRGDEDMVLSPLSVTYALSLLNNGASGQTRHEISEALGFGSDADLNAVNAFCHKVMEASDSLDTQTRMQLANAVFVNEPCRQLPQFQSTAERYYNAWV